ncbi:MAG TPA: DEAD/DEAH box helicase [Kofleriaceae bacterium]|nr:DEAD/DEAH box helicase [Kofleriaceae bacterium]
MVVSGKEVDEGQWAELTSILFSGGGGLRPDGVAVRPLALRVAANELAQVMRRHGLRAQYDHEVKALLRKHVDETKARTAAENDVAPLPVREVRHRIAKTGRFVRPLTKNQQRDVGRLLKLAHGANFSVPGAGKTTALLATYEALRGEGKVDRLLVVAPKNAFLSWETEVGICYPEKRPVVTRLAGGAEKALTVIASDPEIALITYQFLPNVLDAVQSWASRHKMHVVLDESHRVKGGSAGVYSFTALQLAGVAVRRDALSGTPLPNSPEDLRAQLEFLWPGQRILPDIKVKADASESVLSQLQRVVQPLYVRTTKSELNLPNLVPNRVGVELRPLQRELYELLRSEARRIAAGMKPHDMRMLRRLGAHVMTLLEAASNPMLLASMEALHFLDDDEGGASQVWELLREIAASERPAKIEATVTISEEALAKDAKHKVLIWTSFVQNVHLLERLLAAYKPVSLYGEVATGSDDDADTREGRIRIFHEDNACRVMIANPAACGEGISLHRACQHAIYLDRTFNAAHYLQSIDRIHRLGLRKDTPVRVDVLEARWTIDARVASRLKSKIDSMSKILNDPGLAALAYDPLDVVEEFPGGIQIEDVEEIIDHIVEGEARREAPSYPDLSGTDDRLVGGLKKRRPSRRRDHR